VFQHEGHAVSYELHITRAGEWTDAGQHPITLAEWERFAEAHPKLTPDGTVGWTDIGTQAVYSFTGMDGNEAFLSWRGHHVEVWGRLQDQAVADLATLAAQLHARLVGDDEEEYLPDGSCIQWSEPRTPIVPPLQLLHVRQCCGAASRARTLGAVAKHAGVSGTFRPEGIPC